MCMAAWSCTIVFHALILSPLLHHSFPCAGVARTMLKAGALSMKMDMPQALLSMTPAMVAMPAFASVDVRFFGISSCPYCASHLHTH